MIAVGFVVRVAFVSFDNLSIIITMNWLPVFVFPKEGTEDVDSDKL